MIGKLTSTFKRWRKRQREYASERALHKQGKYSREGRDAVKDAGPTGPASGPGT